MRGVGCAGFASAASSGASTAALAGPAATVSVKTRELSDPRQDRRSIARGDGPPRPQARLLTRAIAQTRYSVGWDIDLGRKSGVCRVESADGKLLITYTYPEVAGGVPPALKSRWATFMRRRGASRGEPWHASPATWWPAPNGRSPSSPSATIRDAPRPGPRPKRRIDATYAEYEQRKLPFDAREHRAGGHVDS